MKIDLTPKNLFLISSVSAGIPDTVFEGRSRNTTFEFRAGFVRVQGRLMRKPRTLLTRQWGKCAESLVFPFGLSFLEELISSYNVGYELELEANPDLEKALRIRSEIVTV